jgi:MFS family permease
MSLINRSVPKNRRVFGVTLHSLVRRFPMALGPILGGILIGSFGVLAGIKMAFTAAFGLALLSVLIMHFMVKDDSAGDLPSVALRDSLRKFSRELKTLLAADVLIRFCEQLPYAFLAVWVCNHLKRSEFFFGWLTAIEMFVAVAVYLPVAWLADRGRKKLYVSITFCFFTVFPIILYLAGKLPEWTGRPALLAPLLVFAFVIRGLKEFGEPTRKSLILDLAPEDAKATTFGAYYLVRDVIVGAVALSAGILWQKSPGLNLGISSILGLIGTIIFMRFGKEATVEASSAKS